MSTGSSVFLESIKLTTWCVMTARVLQRPGVPRSTPPIVNLFNQASRSPFTAASRLRFHKGMCRLCGYWVKQLHCSICSPVTVLQPSAVKVGVLWAETMTWLSCCCHAKGAQTPIFLCLQKMEYTIQEIPIFIVMGVVGKIVLLFQFK